MNLNYWYVSVNILIESQIIPFAASGSFFKLAVSLTDMTLVVFDGFLTISYFKLILYISGARYGINPIFRDLCFFFPSFLVAKWFLKIKICTLGLFVAIGLLIVSWPFHGQNSEKALKIHHEFLFIFPIHIRMYIWITFLLHKM